MKVYAVAMVPKEIKIEVDKQILEKEDEIIKLLLQQYNKEGIHPFLVENLEWWY